MDDTDTTPAPIGFDKMRAMLGRASDLRADEQRQVVDLLDEIRTRLGPIEGLVEDGRGRLSATLDNMTSMRARLGELPDRTEVSVIAERLDEALTRIEGQDTALTGLVGAVSILTDQVGRPLEALDARFDGVAGRFEGVAGRLDGLDDRLSHLHSRLDETGSNVDRFAGSVRDRLDDMAGAVRSRFDDDLGRVNGQLSDLVSRPAVDPTQQLDILTGKLDQLTQRLDHVSGRVKAVEESVRSNAGAITGTVEQGVDKITASLVDRPDRDELTRVLNRTQRESETRMTQQLDGALAEFAEVMIGQTASVARPIAASGRTGRKPRKATEAHDDDD